MQQLATSVFVSNDGTVTFSGADFGTGIELLKRSKEGMSVFDTDKNTLVFYCPGQSYFAARWRQGYSPAQYLVFTYDAVEHDWDGKSVDRYSGLHQIASIPVRRNAKQTS